MKTYTKRGYLTGSIQLIALIAVVGITAYGINGFRAGDTDLTSKASGGETFSSASWVCSDMSDGEVYENCLSHNDLVATAKASCQSRNCGDAECDLLEFELGEMCAPSESYQGNITVFQKPLFDHFLHDVEFTQEEEVDSLKVQLTPGEYEPVSFFVHSDADLNDVTIEYGDAINGVDTIPKENIDVRVVKVWKQGGLEKTVTNPEGIDVPELLVADDSENYEGGFHLDELFSSGHDGNALYFNNMAINYYSEGRVDLEKGTIDFWVKPNNWDVPPTGKRLFEQKDAVTNQQRLYISTNSDGEVVAYYNMRELGKMVCTGTMLDNNAWSRITFGWDTDQNIASLYINGSNQGHSCELADVPAMKPRSTFQIGWSTSPQDSYIDSFRSYTGMSAPDELNQANLLFEENFETVKEIKSNDGWLTKPGSNYDYPSPSNDLKTDISENTSKQFWVTVKADDQAAGEYTSMIKVMRDSAVLAQLPININVLPFILRQSAEGKILKNYGIFFQVQDTKNPNWDSKTVNQLQDIKNHGFNSVVVKIDGKSGLDYAALDRTLEKVAEVGFSGPVIVWPYWNEVYEEFDNEGQVKKINVDLVQIKDMVEGRGLKFYMYGNDEPYLLDMDGVKNRTHNTRHHVAKVNTNRKYGAKVFNSGIYSAKYAPDGYAATEEFYNPSSIVYDQFDPRREEQVSFRDLGITSTIFDIVTYNTSRLHDGTRDSYWYSQATWEWLQSLLTDYGVSKNERQETFYWQSRYELPHYNRYISGYFNWVYGLNGVYPHVYQTIIDPNGNNDPFNDFDAPGTGKISKDSMTTYPAKDGFIPTMQWEQFREGIDDVRYLTTLYAMLDELRVTNPGKAESIDNDIKAELEKYRDPIRLNDKFENKLTGVDFEKTRQLVIDKILELGGHGEVNNLLTNSDFSSGKENWSFHTKGQAGFSVVNQEAKVVVTKTSGVIQLFQRGVGLEPNTRYQVSFRAKSTKGNDGAIQIIMDKSPYSHLVEGDSVQFELGTDWQDVSLEITTTDFGKTESNARFRFWLGGQARNGETYSFDDVVLQEL